MNDRVNLNIDGERLFIHWTGVGGAKVYSKARKSIWHQADKIKTIKPLILIISCGSNDLGRAWIQPKIVMQQLFEFVDSCISDGVRFVVLLLLLSRLGEYEGFNSKVDTVNDLMRENIAEKYENVYINGNIPTRIFLPDYLMICKA